MDFAFIKDIYRDFLICKIKVWIKKESVFYSWNEKEFGAIYNSFWAKSLKPYIIDRRP
jgi:hypothetical protein